MTALLLSALLLLAAPPQDGPWFDAPELIPLDAGAWPAGLADVDGDGHADLLTYTTTTFGCWLGTGDGRFVPGPAPVSLGAAAQNDRAPAGLADVDGDGLLDALVTGEAQFVSELQLLAGQGDGSFQPPQVLATGGSLHAAAVPLQWDGDAPLEAAWVVAGVLEVRDTDGGLLTSFDAFPETTYVTRLAAVDLDADGDDELVAHDQWSHRVFLFDGLAGVATLAASHAIPLPLGPGRSTLAVGDGDGDGDPDVVAAALHEVSINNHWLSTTLLANDGTGALTALPTTSVFVPRATNLYGPELALGDWDGDGLADLYGKPDTWPNAVGGGANGVMHLFPNLGGGAFGDPGVHPDLTMKPVAGMADLDGDGLPELISWVVLRGDGRFEVEVDAPFYQSSPSHLVFDLDGDGDVDFQSPAASPGAVYWANDGTGTLTPTLAMPTLELEEREFGKGFVAGDFDGDGLDEQIFELWFDPEGLVPDEYRGLHLLDDDAGVGYRLAGPAADPALAWTGGTNVPIQAFSTDVDGDGHLDVVEGGAFWLGDGSGQLGAPQVLADPGRLVAAGDVEPDGDVDLLALHGDPLGASLWLHRADGGGAYTAELVEPVASIWTRPGLFDMDDDGDLDVVLHASLAVGPSEVLHIHETTPGGFVRHDLGPVSLLSDPGDLLQTDVDGDGLTDLLLLANSTQDSYARVLLMRRSGPGLSYDLQAYLVLQGDGLADGDGDGDVDVLGGQMTAALSVDADTGGALQQYGTGTAGSGGAVPLLGATGPLASGSPSASLRLVRGLGGALAYLAAGFEQAALAGVPKPTTTLLVGGSPVLFLPLTLGGTTGAPGQGQLELPFVVEPSMLGVEVFLQVFCRDLGVPFGTSASNGLRLTFAD